MKRHTRVMCFARAEPLVSLPVLQRIFVFLTSLILSSHHFSTALKSEQFINFGNVYDIKEKFINFPE
jgi:hypothetical protein